MTIPTLCILLYHQGVKRKEGVEIAGKFTPQDRARREVAEKVTQTSRVRKEPERYHKWANVLKRCWEVHRLPKDLRKRECWGVNIGEREVAKKARYIDDRKVKCESTHSKGEITQVVSDKLITTITKYRDKSTNNNNDSRATI